MRKSTVLTVFAVFAFARAQAFAQLTTQNDHGVAIGHVHLFSKDPDAQKKIWVEGFGAKVAKTGTLELLRLPGVFIIINKTDPSAGSAGSTADHIAFSVKNRNEIRSKLAALDIPVEGLFATFPDGLRVELVEDAAQTLPV